MPGDACCEDDVRSPPGSGRPLGVGDGEEQHGAAAEAQRDDAVSVNMDIVIQSLWSSNSSKCQITGCV